ncbi:MAG: hypothetical protein V1493_04010 [Candidatus Diapherotrites archaeon]
MAKWKGEPAGSTPNERSPRRAAKLLGKLNAVAAKRSALADFSPPVMHAQRRTARAMAGEIAFDIFSTNKRNSLDDRIERVLSQAKPNPGTRQSFNEQTAMRQLSSLALEEAKRFGLNYYGLRFVSPQQKAMFLLELRKNLEEMIARNRADSKANVDRGRPDWALLFKGHILVCREVSRIVEKNLESVREQIGQRRWALLEKGIKTLDAAAKGADLVFDQIQRELLHSQKRNLVAEIQGGAKVESLDARQFAQDKTMLAEATNTLFENLFPKEFGRAGQTLLELFIEEANARKDGVQRKLEKAKSNLEELQTLERLRDISRQRYVTERASLSADLEVQRASLEIAEYMLAKAKQRLAEHRK